jgi:tRNA (guanine37-N1)-methyltransferase
VNSLQRKHGLKVPQQLGETTIRLLNRLELIDKGLRIQKNGEALIIPLRRSPVRSELMEFTDALCSFDLVTSQFSMKRRVSKSLSEVLTGTLPQNLVRSLPKSMVIIGRIVIVELSSDLEEWKHQVGRAILQVNHQAETVLAKVGKVEGIYRLRKYEVIAGTGNTKTVHREYGCVYHVDPTVVYFSPRLSEEHVTIASQVKEGEIIVDMFAGVGPFSILIGKTHDRSKVYAIDLNERAYEFLKTNIKINNVKDVVIPLLGDVRVLAEKLTGTADRVIMNLPEKAYAYVDVAQSILKPNGGIVHFYSFESEPNPMENAISKLETIISKSRGVLKQISNKRWVRQIAPRKWQVAIDAVINK